MRLENLQAAVVAVEKCVTLGTILVIVTERSMDLGERQVRMLAAQLLPCRQR